MALYTVLEVTPEEGTWQNEHGEFKTYRLKLEGQAKTAHLNQKSSTAPPQVGASLDLDLQAHPRFPDALKAKKVQAAQGGFGGGGRGKSPEESARIMRMHSQEMAIRFAAVRVTGDLLPEPFNGADLKKLIDWFEADAKTATP